MGQIQSLDELLSFLRRRLPLILIVALIGALAAGIFARTRPDLYEAASVIQVQAATVTGATGEEQSLPAAQLLQSIEQRLMARQNVAEMIDRHGLYADMPALSRDEKIALLRSAVRIQGIESAGNAIPGQTASLSAILIVAQMDNAEMAARIANDMAQGVLDQAAADQRERSAQNVTFFTEEEDRLWRELTALEGEIAAYKNGNQTALPAEAEVLRDELTALDTNLRDLSQQIIAAEGEAAAIRARETMRETDRRQLADVTARIGVLTAQRATSDARRADLTRALAATPEVERVLAGYDRQLGQLQDRYEVVTRRLAEAETELRLGERQQGGRFALLERAETPEYPLSSSGKKIAIAGAMASLLAGVGLAFVLELMFPVVRTAAQMERQLDLRPVVSIPDLPPRRSLAAAPAAGAVLSRPAIAGAAAGLVLLLIAAALLA